MGKTRRYGPLVFWLVALVVVRAAISAHGYRWTWILVGFLVLLGAARVVRNWRGSNAVDSYVLPRLGSHAQAEVCSQPPVSPATVGYRKRMLFLSGGIGLGLSGLCGFVAFYIFLNAKLSDWIAEVFGLFMVAGCWLSLPFCVFAIRGLLGRPALILDADGLIDQSTPNSLGRVLWDDIDSIHWATVSSAYGALPFIAVDRRNGHASLGSRIFGSTRGINQSNLDVSDAELAHLLRCYSGGRFGIAAPP